MVAIPQPGKVTWIVRQGLRIVWRSTVDADSIAMVELARTPRPGATNWKRLPPPIRAAPISTCPPPATVDPKATLVSFNANLSPAQRLAFIGNQWLLRGQFDRAHETLAESLATGETKDAQIALARLDAMSGSLDAARDRVRGILAAHPNDFEALAVFAYIETKFQDYPVAAELYRRALAVQDSPALRMALAKLPTP